MSESNTKPTPSLPQMTDFEFDDVMRVLLGVEPKSHPKAQKQKSSKKTKKSN